MECGLKPPGKLDVSASNLAQAWKQWKEEFTLYADLTVAPSDEKRKIKLFHYLIGEKGREISQTLVRGNDTESMTVKDFIQLFDKHCDPKKNETVERFKFFSRNQETGETIDIYATQLKILAAGCEFGDLKDSLIRDRIVCGIQDSHLRERLLREENLDLEKCTQICRASQLTKDSLKMIESSADVGVHAVLVTRHSQKFPHTLKFPDNTIQCKYCGRRHERNKEKCPAYGQLCRACGKQDHFANQCRQKNKPKQRPVNTVTQNTDSDSAEDLWWIQLQPAAESVNMVKQQEYKDTKQLFATFLLEEKPVRFQLDCGASCNIIPSTLINTQVTIQPTDQVLVMYNKTTLKPVGTCRLKIRNPCNQKSYRLDFIVVNNGDHSPLLGVKAVQAMDLIKVQSHNIMSLDVSQQTSMLEQKTSGNLDLQFVRTHYADLFEGDGCLEGTYKFEIDVSIQPSRLPTRRVPVSLMLPLKDELTDLQSRRMIAPVQKSTDWISSLVIVKKPSGKLRICIDPKPLNRALKRSHYPMPIIEDILPDLSKARIFSVCDVKNGFWHVKLDEQSSYLTTFSTPFGRYRWLRLPMGASPAPEVFQQKLNQALEGLPGIKTIADDILIVGEGDDEESAIKDHDKNMIQFLNRCREKQIKLNLDKFRMKMAEVPYIGHLLTSNGLKVDPEKVKAVQEMPTPTDVRGVMRFLGMVNYLSKFCKHLSDMCEPLRQLTHKDVLWEWTDIQETAFQEVKKAIADTATLKYFNPEESAVLQCDASETGLGATLMQRKQPIAFASRALTPTEQAYAQIEKELLAVLFGMEKFHQYTYGRQVQVHSDHKPLESITKKPLLNAPKRLQRMLLQLQKYDFDISYCPGKDLCIADTLSRAYLPTGTEGGKDIEHINMCEYLAVSKNRLEEIQSNTEKDKKLQVLKNVILAGWPKYKQHTPVEVLPFFHVRDELSVQDGVIFKGERAVIPESLRRNILERLHSTHTGVEGCLRRARECVYWPGMNDQIKQWIEKCEICASWSDKQQKETLQPHAIPDRPWSKVGLDLFSWNNKEYLVTVDYFSNFWEVDYLPDTRAKTMIKKLKAHFARYGIPEIVISDNGPQLTSDEFKQFSRVWDFQHQTSSPGYPQSNGKAESAVKTAKRLMQKAEQAGTDVYLSLLDYRNTPSQGLESSPTQRLMSRRTRTLLPTMTRLLKPKLVENCKEKLQTNQRKQAWYYDKSAKDLPALQRNDTVRIQPMNKYQKQWQKAKVVQKKGSRSYEVITEEGRKLRRNRRHLRKTEERFRMRPSEPAWDNDTYPSTTADTEATRAMQDEEQRETAVGRENARDISLPVSVQVPQELGQAPYVTRAGRTTRKPAHMNDYV